MAVKKAKKKSAKKKTVKKTAKKKIVKKAVKRTAGKGVKKITAATTGGVAPGSQYECYVCGLVVSVDEVCGCMETCDIICCGEQMEPVY